MKPSAVIYSQDQFILNNASWVVTPVFLSKLIDQILALRPLVIFMLLKWVMKMKAMIAQYQQ